MAKLYQFFDPATGTFGADSGPVATPVPGRVHAHKNGTNQSVTFVTDVPVLVTFGTEVTDTEGDFASSALTVGSGESWIIHGAVTIESTNNGQYHCLDLFKDGSLYLRLTNIGSWEADPITLPFYAELTEAGSYDIRASLGLGTTRNIIGTTTRTYIKARRFE